MISWELIFIQSKVNNGAEIACSRRIGLGQRKLGFKCGCVISGEVMANALSRHTLETADEPACSAVVFSKA